MKKKQYDVFIERLKNATDTFAASSFTGAFVLLYHDGKIDYTYWGLSAYMVFLAAFVYFAMTVVLIDNAGRDDNDSDVQGD